ncbi:M1 family metallopeptidase [Streptomyces olivochromogenes]|uniref:M1 family metallopeptidase n=1 Tax=Streptomyces olivochromogenes TaxID=1963 RepID=UPI001F378C5F|nr:M1 family metallopeptidase [Streptomyces olivochromogenes]MCF3130642.1 M1 family metallopeptidase [Streptomyces olivochromogenes]
MSRSARLVPVVPVVTPVVSALLALTLVACDGGVRGTSGGSGVRDPYFPKAGNGGYDVAHYGLTLAYDPGDHRLTGTARITARATQDLSAFDLDLKGLHVESVTVEGARARWNRAGQELTVRPHDDLDKGETFTAIVRYSGVPLRYTDPDGSSEGWLRTPDGALALGQPTGSMAWFPSDNHPSDKATYDIAVTVPEGLQAVSNGELGEETTAHGRTTFTWHTAEPMATYVATVGIGHYRVTRSTLKSGLPVYTAVDPSRAEESREVLARIPEIMEWGENNFGPYPFSSTGAIVDPVDDVPYALETQNRPSFPGVVDTPTLVHELAHQWYGNSVTPKTWRDMWLNEAFATYAEWLWAEDHGGPSAQETFDAFYDGVSDEAGDEIWDFPPAKPTSAAHVSDPPVYDRGAMVLHKIRQKVGDDTFYDIIQGWAAAHRHGNADTDDFTAYVEKTAPDEDFAAIWDDWLYGEGKPDHR